MKEPCETFPFITITFIFILFLNLGFPLFREDKGAFVAILFLMFLTTLVVAGSMAYYNREPVIAIPVTIFLLVVSMLLFGKQEERTMVQINLPDVAVLTIIGGVIIAVIGGVTTAARVLWRIWRDSKSIDNIKGTVDRVDGEVVSLRGKEINIIESHTSDIHNNMMSKVLPGMEKLDSINGFVTKIDINTQNSGGDIKLIFAEANKMVEKLESLHKEVEQLKSQNTELRMENSQLKQRNRTLEYLQGQRNRDQYLEQ